MTLEGKQKEKIIRPDVSAGLERMSPTIIKGWVLLSIVYLVLKRWARPIASWIHLPSTSPDFCSIVDSSDSTTCFRGDLFAFQVASGLALTICAIVGFRCWHVSRRVHTLLPPTPQGRLFGYLPEAELLATINFCFQSWDFVVSSTIPEHATPIFLGHHIMASIVSFCSIRYQILHYYGVFFLGLSEVSSFFLVFLDLSKFNPPRESSWYERWVLLVCGPMFVICFLYYRVLLWWPVSYQLWCDVRSVIANGQAEKIRGRGANWVLFVFLALNLPLGVLQLYWVTIIAEEVVKTAKTM